MRHAYEQSVRESRAIFAKRAQLAGLMLLGCVSLAAAADKVAELNDDFLEYLGSMEGSDDNWTDFANSSAAAGHEQAQPAVKIKDSKTVVNASSSSAASVTTKAASSTTGKADK